MSATGSNVTAAEAAPSVISAIVQSQNVILQEELVLIVLLLIQFQS